MNEVEKIDSPLFDPDDIKFAPPTPEVTAAVDAALGTVSSRSFSGRNPHLGKMVNCLVCDLRHRGTQCQQRFARYDENDPTSEERTAIPFGEQATRNQSVGAHPFKRKRIKPHPSKVKLQFIEESRRQFEILAPDANLSPTNKEEIEMLNKLFLKARVLAARVIRSRNSNRNPNPEIIRFARRPNPEISRARRRDAAKKVV